MDGERSCPIRSRVPAAGGLRVILVAGIARAAERAQAGGSGGACGPASTRALSCSAANTRIVGEFQDDTLRVFYHARHLNSARARVDIGGPLVLDLPESASLAALLAESSKQAKVEGTRLTVTGPFNPGTTAVQVGFQAALLGVGPDLDADVAGGRSSSGLSASRRSGVCRSRRRRFQTHRGARDGRRLGVRRGERPADAGRVDDDLHLSNLPAQSRVASRVALGIALALIALGVWLSVSGRSGDAAARRAS